MLKDHFYYKKNSLQVLTVLCIYGLLLVLLYTVKERTFLRTEFLNLASLYLLSSHFLVAEQVFSYEVKMCHVRTMYLDGCNFYAFLMRRYISYTFIVSLPLFSLTFIMLLAYGYRLPSNLALVLWLWLYVLYGLIAAFTGLLTLGARLQKELMFLVALPFYLPLLFFQVRFLDASGLLSPSPMAFQFLLGLSILYTITVFTISEQVLKINART
tara:strand:+ start:137 stop:775 length:639 start_codon:yes stop_codon:yes gene_type:complete